MKSTRKSGIIVTAVFAIVAVALAVSCAKPPVAEMEAANQALTKAEADADARLYAPDSLTKARDLIARMKAGSDEKRYDDAKTLAAEAVVAAEKAIQDGVSGKAKAKSDATSLIATVKATLAEVQQAFAAARKVRGIKLDATAVDTGLKEAATTLAGAESDNAKADYKAAIGKAQNTRSSLAALQKLVTDAVQAASRKK
ncbi:MAG: hypothetical protein A2Y38_06705 [Spirochaetes bacterium GWB1_59_5]|nr:MAG: hypothetical protein A2Y38_06705 [Spirochaetes bacterium GWB1_59_5]